MFSSREILKVVRDAKIFGLKGDRLKGISIDTRTIKPGELFIPIKGPNHDGRRFISVALEKGAAVLETRDGLKALQALAAYHRRRFKIPVVGVTGSVGKTTTKDMIASILSQEMATLKNEENFNNEIGVPLTLLKLTKKHKAAVIEMGMQRLGEIKLLADIARPTVAVITNIGESHLEFLKTRSNIARAKAEIFTFLKNEDHGVINQDDEYFEHLKKKLKGRGSRIVTFGILEKADITPKELEGVELPIPGEHNYYNALAAIAVARIFRIKRSAIVKGLRKFTPSAKRMEVIIRPNDKVKVINDTYNASPLSMRALLRTIASMKGRRIAVLGDMLELGKEAKASHRKIFEFARDLKIEKIFTYGNLWPKAALPVKDKQTLVKKIKKIIRPRDIILVKGSRGMRMEEVVEALI